MKIICVGRNYSEHARELKNETPEEPVLFMKSDTSILRNSEFYIPEFSNDIHYEVELLLKISKPGKYIPQENAHKYFQEIGLGIDFTARDLQSQLKAKGLPWEKAKSFDGSAVVSHFLPLEDFNREEIHFHLNKNKEKVQIGNSQNMIFSFDALVAYISKFFTLKTGDIIFTGTPAGVGKVNEGDILDGFLEDKKMFSVKIY